MGKKHYKSITDLKEIDDVLKLSETILVSKQAVLKASSSIPKIVATSLAAVTGTGAAVVASSGAGVTVAGVATTVSLGAMGTVGGITLAPIAIPVVLVSGIGLLVFKNKKAKELNEALQSRYKKAVEKQNQIIKTYNEKLKVQKAEMETKSANYEKIINSQAEKIDELLTMQMSLKIVIEKMEQQLAV